MRLSELATVSKFERQKTVYVGATAVSVIRLFLRFFSISLESREMATDGYIHY